MQLLMAEAQKRLIISEQCGCDPVKMFTVKEDKPTCLQSKTMHPNVETGVIDSKSESESEGNGRPRKKFKTSDGNAKSSSFSAEEILEDELFKEYLNCKWVR